MLAPRWTLLRPHPEQQRLFRSQARIRIVAAGRRSGKTDLAKRWHIIRAIAESRLPDARVVFSAPTHAQAKEIYWADLKAMLPRWAVSGEPRESELAVRLINGARIQVAGLDKPQRIEGSPLDAIVVDEIANCKPDAWEAHILPALYTRGRAPGTAWLIGVPEGRNHFWKLFNQALAQRAARGAEAEMDAFTWPSWDILPADEIAQRKATMDEATYAQEYGASFVNFAGRAYYAFERAVHAAERVPYDPGKPLIFCFDFNVDPGVAAVVQELYHQQHESITAVIGEVWIPRNSNTPAVCRRLLADWGAHPGEVHCYGDATGGARGTAKVAGSDWDLIRSHLRPAFGDRLRILVPRENPHERPRINSLNSRLRTASGAVHLLVDPVQAPHVVEDLEGVVLLEGGSGEIQKVPGGPLSHLSDAIGYYVIARHPITGRTVTVSYAG